MFATVALLAALGILLKLGFRPASSERLSTPGISAGERRAEPAPTQINLLEKYRSRPESERAVVAQVWDKFRQMAVMIDRTDGFRGLELLDRLDLEAIYLYEKHPREFRQLRELVSDRAAADILLHWREYFGLKRGDHTDRGILIAELGRLSGEQRRLVSTYSNVLPIMLTDPGGVADVAEVFGDDDADLGDALAILSLVSLEPGSADLRVAQRTLERHGSLALEGFRILGPEGFALVGMFGLVFEELGTSVPLDQALVLARVNSDYLAELLTSHRPATVARHLAHVFTVGPTLVEAVGGHPDALRLVVEFGERGEKALLTAGPDAAEVVYGDFADPALRGRAVGAIGDHGPAAVAILDKYATDPDFHAILWKYGSAVIPPIAHSDASPEILAKLQAKTNRSFAESLANVVLFASGDNGQATIRQIKKDGLERVVSLSASELKFYQFLPTYDVLHLGNVLKNGHSPTSGEMTWALIDGCFVMLDALSLAALQPEGAAVSEAVRNEVKSAVRAGSAVAGRALRGTGDIGTTATQRLARWWAVRSAGGTYQVLRRAPEALPKVSLSRLTDLARPLCAKAGIRLSSWTPVRLWKDGVEVVSRIPADRGIQYLTAQVAVAQVGFVGFKKMEEHFASRRPSPRTSAE
jgi:hypothetical protein